MHSQAYFYWEDFVLRIDERNHFNAKRAEDDRPARQEEDPTIQVIIRKNPPRVMSWLLCVTTQNYKNLRQGVERYSPPVERAPLFSFQWIVQ